jgi:molecular chaperone DnaK
MSTAIGIDLGTTFSAISCINRHGVPEILPNELGKNITPSVIFFENDQIIVGEEAERGAVAYPEQVVQFVKRHIGEPDYRFSYNGREWNAVELSAEILRALVQSAKARTRDEITQAVITVPAYFGQNERSATIKAAESIGLEVLKIINEPTAAAVAYGLNQLRDQNRCLVFDLGGGTFDVTIIEINQHIIRVKSTDGDDKLGGKDWDDRLMKYVSEAFKDQYGINIMDDVLARHELRERCVSAKKALSQRPEMTLSFQHQNKPIRLKITRDHFEAITADLLKRCEEKTLEALSRANSTPEDIDTILLVGGSTRMPMFAQRIKEIFGKEPSREINPDECVAMGAAITAAIESAIRRNEAPPIDIETHDVASHQLGLVVLKDNHLYNTPIIKKNTPIPTEHTQSQFQTMHSGQAAIDLWLVQGESKDPQSQGSSILGHFEFFGLPRVGEQIPISITYRYNANGIVEVEASQPEKEGIFLHRVAKDRYGLEEVLNKRVPANIAVIVDSSGSMYGEPLQQAKSFIQRFSSTQLSRRNRNMALYSYPEGLLGKPSNQSSVVAQQLKQIVPIGFSLLQVELKRAKEHLKGRSGIIVLLSDGHISHIDEVRKIIATIHKMGCTLFVIGVGQDRDEDILKSLCVHPQFYRTADRDLDVSKHLIKLLKHT